MHIAGKNTLLKLTSSAVLLLAITCLTADSLAYQSLTQFPVLTAEDGQYIVFDSLLNEHSFTQHNNGELIASARTSGTLVQLDDGHYRWTDANGQQHRFEGSQFVGLESDDDTLECLPLPTPGMESIVIPPNSPGLEEDPEERPEESTEESTEEIVEQSIEETAQGNNEEIIEHNAEEELQCDVETQSAHSFSTPAYAGELTLLDARPASCESYFVQYYGTQRGSEIEIGLHQHSPYRNMNATLRTFPVIDFYDDNALYVVHSRDLGNRTFNSTTRPNALLDQLLEDGEQIQTRFIDVILQEGSITASELGNSTTISHDQLRPVTLQLVIRDGIASASHWQQIIEARETLWARYGITLEVVVIP